MTVAARCWTPAPRTSAGWTSVSLPCIEACRGNTDCADICDTTGRVLSGGTGFDADLTRAASRPEPPPRAYRSAMA